MPVYEYSALDSGGRRRRGIVDAGSIAAANQKLRETGVYPEEIVEAAGLKGKGSAAADGAMRLFRKVGLRELASMTRQLATLIGAGLPLVPSLSALAAQITHPTLKAALARIKNEVNEGNSLTQSLSLFPDIFPPFYINMIRAGEASGTMHLVLDRLADFNEKQQALRTRIRSALAYPLLMFLIGSGVLLFLIAFVVPNITGIFREMNQALPGITVFLIVVSGFLQTYWWVMATIGLAAYAGLRHVVRNRKEGRRRWDGFLLSAPLFGGLNRKIAVARFSRTLGTLLQSGVPLLSALDIARNVVSNTVLAEQIALAARDVEEGQSLSAPLSRNGFFPSIAVEMMTAGEQSGNMEAMLFRIADAYEKEVEANVLLVTSLLEPLMIVAMGAVVGFIVVSILLPIFEMNQLVR